jgi:hypothetical protein
MANKARYTCGEVIAALKRTKGMVFLAAQELGCSHQTVYNYINRHPTVAAAKKEAEGKVGDTAELKLYQAILNGEHWAITFYLATKGKDRGYTKRQEIVGKDEGPIQHEDVTLTDEERLERIAAILDRARARRTGPATDGPGEDSTTV